jgi:hypothetical protein
MTDAEADDLLAALAGSFEPAPRSGFRFSTGE